MNQATGRPTAHFNHSSQGVLFRASFRNERFHLFMSHVAQCRVPGFFLRILNFFKIAGLVRAAANLKGITRHFNSKRFQNCLKTAPDALAVVSSISASSIAISESVLCAPVNPCQAEDCALFKFRIDFGWIPHHLRPISKSLFLITSDRRTKVFLGVHPKQFPQCPLHELTSPLPFQSRRCISF